MRKLLQLLFIICTIHPCIAQDSLRGSVTPERAWWDVLKYDITVEPDAVSKSITGSNIITFKALKPGKRMQIDLQEPMEITDAFIVNRHSGNGSRQLSFKRFANVYYLDFTDEIKKGAVCSLQIKFAGIPREAVSPPWDGGWIWKQDKNGSPWISVACQSLGASVWYPCKDYQGDEPDSAVLSIICADSLAAVGNGRLRTKQQLG